MVNIKKTRKAHLFGAHLSIAGGLHNAIAAGEAMKCEAIQIFVKNQRQWKAPPLKEEDADRFKEAWKNSAIHSIIAHSGYLINLGSQTEETRQKGIAALLDELHRCEQLGISGLVLHPGSHGGDGVSKGIQRIVSGLNEVHKQTTGYQTQILLETTAGQGNSIGSDFEHLQRILKGVEEPERIGICLDTCHMFAAGYDIADAGEYESTVQQLHQAVGLERIQCIHMNDAKKECGSKVDRHAHIGEGCIGDEGFALIVNDDRFTGVPMILETSKEKDEAGRDMDEVNLQRLRSLIR